MPHYRNGCSIFLTGSRSRERSMYLVKSLKDRDCLGGWFTAVFLYNVPALSAMSSPIRDSFFLLLSC